jgi:hypothetical protein
MPRAPSWNRWERWVRRRSYGEEVGEWAGIDAKIW